MYVVLDLRASHFDNIVIADGIDLPRVVVGSAVLSVGIGLVLVFPVVFVVLHSLTSQFRLSIGQRSKVADLMEEWQVIPVG